MAAWRYLIAVELASLAITRTKDPKHPQAKSITKYFDDNYGGVEPTLGDILRPSKLKLSQVSFEPSVLGNKLGGVALDRSGDDLSFGRELDAVFDCTDRCGDGHCKGHFD